MSNRFRAAVTVALGMGALAACRAEAPLAPEPPAESTALGSPDGQFCGGFGGFPCPDHDVCVDDPDDDCDPRRGGADCPGICIPEEDRCSLPGRYYASHDPAVCAVMLFRCPPGFAYFVDECGCGCERSWSGGGRCGDEQCLPSEYCCNPSCGICAPFGGACILVECE